MNFWQTFRKAVKDVTKTTQWKFFSDAVGKQKTRYYLTLPIFNVSTPVWIGSSYITTEFWCSGLSSNFSLQPAKLTSSSNCDFCLAVRWPQRNNSGLGVVRYKLWENVGERLVYPLYTGQLIDKNCVFEIWSTSSNKQTSLSIPFNIFISALLTPNNYSNCCNADNNQLQVLTQVCSLFEEQNDSGSYDLPIVFDDCFDQIINPNDTFYRITEDNSIRSNEVDDRRVYK